MDNGLDETADDFLSTVNDDDSNSSIRSYQFVPELIPSIISFSCSIFIIQHVTRTRLLEPNRNSSRQRTRTQQGNSFPRLIIGMCVFDAISSLTLFTQPLAALFTPVPLVGHWSCSLLGFTKLLGISCSSGYNAFMSTYFYFVVVRNWTEEYIAACFEPLSHAFVGVMIMIWIAAIPLEAFNPEKEERTCWPRLYPVGCTIDGAEETPVCSRGDPWGWIYGIFATAAFLSSVIILIATNIAIYCKVRRTQQRSQRYAVALSSSRFEILSREPGSNTVSTELTANNLSRDFRIEGNSKTAERISRRDKTREVAVQSFLYCAGYLATYFVTFIMGVSGLENNSDHMGKWWFELLLVLRGVTFPFQGFFNFCAYMRPKYMQWREIQLYRDVVPSRWKALRGAMNAEPLPDSRTLRLMKRSYIARTQQSSRDDEDARMSESGPQGLSTTHEETAAENNSARTISCTEALCRRIGLPGSGNTRPSSVVTSTVSTESEAPRQIKGQLGPDSLTRLSMEYDDENLAKIPSPSHAETLNFEEAKDNSILQRMVVDMGNPITASDVGPTISEDSSAMTP